MLLLDNYFDELKIRIWHKGEKKLMYFNNPTLINGDTLQGGLLFKNYDHKIQNVEECRPNDFIIMFSSGKNDKDGKPIYSGDIVKLSNDKIGFVVYEYQTYTIHFSKKDKLRRWPLGAYEDEELTIVGNIYENSEVIPA